MLTQTCLQTTITSEMDANFQCYAPVRGRGFMTMVTQCKTSSYFTRASQKIPEMLPPSVKHMPEHLHLNYASSFDLLKLKEEAAACEILKQSCDMITEDMLGMWFVCFLYICCPAAFRDDFILKTKVK